MPEEVIEHPAVGAADLETRKAAQENANDVFNDGTTDDSAASATSAKEEGLKTGEEMADLTGVKPGEEKPDSNEALVKALQKAFPQGAPVKETVKQPELTQEQINKVLKKVTVSDEDFAEILDPTKGKAKLQALLDAAGQNGAAMAGVMFESLKAEFAPQLQQLQEQRYREHVAKEESAFFTEYPALNKPEFQDILGVVTERLMSDKANIPKTPAERRKRLAEETEKMLKAVNPAFTLSSVSKTVTKPNTTVPRQAVAATTGVGGGGGTKPETKTPSEANRSTGVDVFD